MLAVWINGLGAPDPVTAPIADGEAGLATPFATPEDIFQADLTEQEFRHVVSRRADADALLLVAIDGG